MKARASPQRIRELLSYDAGSGELRWTVRVSARRVPGARAGHRGCGGYRQIVIDGKKYQEHRVVWAHVYLAWPTNDIDHIDGNRDNNAITNLRDVPRAANIQNQRKANPRNRSGLLGVSQQKYGFVAEITANGTRRVLGFFDSAVKAHAAYLEAKRRLHQGCTI